MLDLLPFAIISDVCAAILVISKGAESVLILETTERSGPRLTRIKRDDRSGGSTSGGKTCNCSQGRDAPRLIDDDQWLVTPSGLPD